MNIQTNTPKVQTRALTAQSQSVTLSQEKGSDDAKLSTVDAVSVGATSWGNKANTAIGVWNGGVGGAIAGGAIGLGAEAVSAVVGAINGTATFNWGTLVNTVATTGVGALVGGGVGAVVGGVTTNLVGKGVGNFTGKAVKKFGGNENVGRAIGTVGTGVALGTMVGASVAGVNGAVLALGAGALGGALAFVNN